MFKRGLVMQAMARLIEADLIPPVTRLSEQGLYGDESVLVRVRGLASDELKTQVAEVLEGLPHEVVSDNEQT